MCHEDFATATCTVSNRPVFDRVLDAKGNSHLCRSFSEVSDLLLMEGSELFAKLSQTQSFRFMLLNRGKSLPETRDPRDWGDYLRRGATLIVNRVHHHVPTVAELAANLRYDIGYETHVNLYCSPSKQQGFECHYDNHDVLILQIDGEKEWFVYRETELYPTLKHSSDQPKPQASPYLQCVLKAGDLLYIREDTGTMLSLANSHLHLYISLSGLSARQGLTGLVGSSMTYKRIPLTGGKACPLS